MKIRGKEIQFLRTVKTTSDLAKLCPDEDIERIGELFDGNVVKVIETGAKIIHYLNEGYEMNKYYEEKLKGNEYKPDIIEVDEILYLDEKSFTQLMKEAFEGLNNGARTTVELEDTKKNEKAKE